MREVIFAQGRYNLGHGIGTLHRHERQPLVGKGRVETYGNMYLRAREEHVESGLFADGRHGDASRTPRHAPRRGEYVDGAQYGIDIVGRFAHAHKDDIGKAFALGYRQHLVDYSAGIEVALPAALACHAEAAIHLAAGLARYAQGGTVVVGDIYRLDIAAPDTGKEIFHGAVGAAGLGYRGLAPNDIPVVAQPCPGRLWQVGHGINLGDAALIEPRRHLLCREAPQPGLGSHGLEPGNIKSDKFFHVS